MIESRDCAEVASQVQRRRRRTQQDTPQRRADRAEAMVQLGELSARRQALEAAPIAPGNMRTSSALTDIEPSPLRPRAPIPAEILFMSLSRFWSWTKISSSSLKSARKGAAGGPSGMLSECVSSRDHSSVACGEINSIVEAICDIIRRLVARTISRQIGPSIETATAPFQYALSTRAGTECVCHVRQALTDNDERATILSVDGIGAFDLIFRESMMRGLLEVEGGGKVLPFVRQFYGSPSTHLWEDEEGAVHFIPQGEGEQGDPLILALFSLGQHRALEAVQSHLGPTERLFAFLDHIHVVCSPDRVWQFHEDLRTQLWTHAKIQMHKGKTQVWNQKKKRHHGQKVRSPSAKEVSTFFRNGNFAFLFANGPNILFGRMTSENTPSTGERRERKENKNFLKSIQMDVIGNFCK